MTRDELYDLQTARSEMVNLIDSQQHSVIRDDFHDRLLTLQKPVFEAEVGFKRALNHEVI